MTRSELIVTLAEKYPHLLHHDLERIVDCVFDSITGALTQGHRVELRGFGTFGTKTRRARSGRNPRTGDTVHVAEKRVPYFRTGKELRARLNKKTETV
jgi:integration host factor subunit beta